MSKTKTSEAKELFFSNRTGIIELAKKYDTSEENERYKNLSEREYLAIKLQQLKANFNIGIGDVSYAMQRSAAWLGSHKSGPESRTPPSSLSGVMAMRMEILTYGFIRREFSLPRAEVKEAKEAGILFNRLTYPDTPYYFVD